MPSNLSSYQQPHFLYYENPENMKAKITKAGGKISKDTFSFPGGKRFHFIDPSGNELAVWSDR